MKILSFLWKNIFCLQSIGGGAKIYLLPSDHFQTFPWHSSMLSPPFWATKTKTNLTENAHKKYILLLILITFVVMVPSPSLSKREKASRNSEIWETKENLKDLYDLQINLPPFYYSESNICHIRKLKYLCHIQKLGNFAKLRNEDFFGKKKYISHLGK